MMPCSWRRCGCGRKPTFGYGRSARVRQYWLQSSGAYHNDGQGFLDGGIGDSCLNRVCASASREGLSAFPSRGTERAYKGFRRWHATAQADVLERRKTGRESCRERELQYV